MYIVTNTTMGGEYTPSKAETLEEARQWLLECTANNIRIWKEDKEESLSDMTNEEVIEWAKKNLSDFSFSPDNSEIWYDDESYNIMNIYNLDEI